jgi:hypothetical protein
MMILCLLLEDQMRASILALAVFLAGTASVISSAAAEPLQELDTNYETNFNLASGEADDGDSDDADDGDSDDADDGDGADGDGDSDGGSDGGHDDGDHGGGDHDGGDDGGDDGGED